MPEDFSGSRCDLINLYLRECNTPNFILIYHSPTYILTFYRYCCIGIQAYYVYISRILQHLKQLTNNEYYHK